MLKTNKILSLTLLLSTIPMIGMERPGNQRRPVLRPTARPAAAVPNQSKQCQICTDEKPIIDFRTLSCGHNIACAACLKSIAEQAIEQKRTTTLKCPDMRCNRGIEERDLKKIIYNKSQQEEIADIQLQEWIRQQPGAKNCPTTNCAYAFINGDQVAGQIDCPSCNHRYCNQCLHPHAQNITCQDAELSRNPNAAERASQAWKQQNTKACPHCNAAIEKNEGCLHMTCRSCTYQFCWNCLGDWRTHYDNYNCQNRVNTPVQAQQQAAAHQRPVQQQAPAAPQVDRVGRQWNPPQPAYVAPNVVNLGVQRNVQYRTEITLPYFHTVNVRQVTNHFGGYNIQAQFNALAGHVTLSGPIAADQMFAVYNEAIRLGIL